MLEYFVAWRLRTMADTPKVFISYSRDTNEHVEAVVALADRLRADGIDCNLDEYEEAPFEGWYRWMVNQIDSSEYALVICTEVYKRRFEGQEKPGIGLGANWEGAIITSDLYQDSNTNDKFIPVLLTGVSRQQVPKILKPYTYYDLSTTDGYDRLYRRLTKQPLTPKPPLGGLKPMPPRPRVTQVLGSSPTEDAVTFLLSRIRRYVEGLLPGVVPRVGASTITTEAVLAGFSSEDSIRALENLRVNGVLAEFSIGGGDELLVNLNVLRDLARTPTANQLHPAAPDTRLAVEFQTRFLDGDQASEPNYYVNIVVRNNTAEPLTGLRFAWRCSTPRNPWDPNGGAWPINNQPGRLSHAGIQQLVDGDVFAATDSPTFRSVGSWELRDPDTVIFPRERVTVVTVEVFGPDLIIDWHLDTISGSSHGRQRCGRPRAETHQDPRFDERSRLALEIRDSRLVDTPDGDRLVAEVLAVDYDLGVEVSCWAEVLSQTGTDLTGKYLVKEAMALFRRLVREMKVNARRALANAQSIPDSDFTRDLQIRMAQDNHRKLSRLEQQILIETPIRVDDFYSSLLAHYRALGNEHRARAIMDEWNQQVARSRDVDFTGLDGRV